MRSVISTVLCLALILLFVGTGCGGPPKGVVLNERMGQFCLAVVDSVLDDGPSHISEDLFVLAIEACDAWSDWSEDKYPGGSLDQY